MNFGQKSFTHANVLVTGGTGSVGKHIVKRVLTGELGEVKSITVFSDDEAQQHDVGLEIQDPRLRFMLGDVRNYSDVCEALRDINIVFHAAALKYVPICEYAPFQAVHTNILGAENIVRGVMDCRPPVEVVVGISTDKACYPVSVMGMTKALQERVLIHANLRCPGTRFVCTRFGNILTSRGSVLQLFLDQIARGGPITLTDPWMTRFLLSLDEAVDVVFAAMNEGNRGEIFVPVAYSALMVDVVESLCKGKMISTEIIGLRPGEKLHEIMINEEELPFVRDCSVGYAISSTLPELMVPDMNRPKLDGPYSSEKAGSFEETHKILHERILKR